LLERVSAPAARYTPSSRRSNRPPCMPGHQKKAPDIGWVNVNNMSNCPVFRASRPPQDGLERVEGRVKRDKDQAFARAVRPRDRATGGGDSRTPDCALFIEDPARDVQLPLRTRVVPSERSRRKQPGALAVVDLIVETHGCAPPSNGYTVL